MRKIVLCGSKKFIHIFFELEQLLKSKGYKVVVPREFIEDIPKREASLLHFSEIEKDDVDALLIVNESKNGLDNYIGANGFAELAFGFYKGRKVFLLNDVYEPYAEEIVAWEVIPLCGNIDSIDNYLVNNSIQDVFKEIRNANPNMSLDELLFAVYDRIKKDNSETFDSYRELILGAVGIDEYEYYTSNVDSKLKLYVEDVIFPQYDKNDKAHGIVHIREVIRRAFALNDTLKLNLDHNMIFAIAACHDLGKYIDHETHERIAAQTFYEDNGMKQFFSEEERIVIKEAIEDHRSSKEDNPRTIYGQLISSADRNTRIEIVFIRSFFVAHERMPETVIEEYLDYTYKRLSKRYGEENPENMFLEDETYRIFLRDMRCLLQNEEEFKNRYCDVNHITSRENKVSDEHGEIGYNKIKKKDE